MWRSGRSPRGGGPSGSQTLAGSVWAGAGRTGHMALATVYQQEKTRILHHQPHSLTRDHLSIAFPRSHETEIGREKIVKCRDTGYSCDVFLGHPISFSTGESLRIVTYAHADGLQSKGRLLGHPKAGQANENEKRPAGAYSTTSRSLDGVSTLLAGVTCSCITLPARLFLALSGICADPDTFVRFADETCSS